ncbi:hypothetical protein SERLA73DRAFT_106044 [Serpula lacrymans var. lacrymans S7.3]|uniref:Uncharacterized protein n=2 Tax=Serpula lacrymans var. lacrymans TaxID=341189 RepID=F8PSR1_SERL3|nr:uncharacterized protein SERLADRAFT_464668 [Serpula lacrymans var. lacrymans S7.9]EGO01339.1 hypothetical protein SERLA73DRAFT_106044 [Serpula lacrymans var. lacrymans S7.3]EGO26976.1 hypothetical protein SERLADRAFT_464668 [Serpula lacrymans var. lacrymans S7.9]
MLPLSIVSSPTPSAASRLSDGSRHSDGPLPFPRNPSVSDFEIERPTKFSPAQPKRPLTRRLQSDYDNEHALRASVSRLIAAKARPFTVSGRIPMDPSALILFFRSKSGITHSLDFPIDVDIDTPPALDVLIAACRPHQVVEFDTYSDRESLFYPPNLPLTATLEIANHPILEAVRNMLFPNLPVGHYLITTRDKLEVVVCGGRTPLQPSSLRNDGRVATIQVTLPVRFRGGGLVIRDAEGREEKYYGRGGKAGDMEWTAFLAECEYEVEPVQRGCRISISYGVHLKTFGPTVDPLITPSEKFLDFLTPVLNMSRGRKIAFYLTQEYTVNPSEVLADSLVPHLKGNDSLLYHAIKIFKLAPELHWSAGGYIWPIDRTVECGNEAESSPSGARMTFGGYGSSRRTAGRAFSGYGDSDEEEAEIMRAEADSLRFRVEESGAIPLAEAEIFVLSDWSPGPMSKEKVPFVSNGELEKLLVNVLLVTYVP